MSNDLNKIEAAVFRRVIDHFRENTEVQNIDVMETAGFCRNCLSRWYREEAKDLGIEITEDASKEIIYGMPYKEWKEKASDSHISKLLSDISKDTKIITVIDGYSAALAWIGSVKGNRVFSLGVDSFGQSGDTIDLYKEYEVDSEAIIGAIANALLF